MDALSDLIAAQPVLVLAHPGSGTQFLVELLRSMGVRADHEVDEGGDVVVSPRYWPPVPRGRGAMLSRFSEVWALSRDPLATVFSAAGLCDARPEQRLLISQWMRDPRIMEGGSPLAGMLRSVLTFYGRAGRLASRWIAIEDVPVPAGWTKPRNRHSKVNASWPLLAACAPGREAWVHTLRDLSLRLSDRRPSGEGDGAGALSSREPGGTAAPRAQE